MSSYTSQSIYTLAEEHCVYYDCSAGKKTVTEAASHAVGCDFFLSNRQKDNLHKNHMFINACKNNNMLITIEYTILIVQND